VEKRTKQKRNFIFSIFEWEMWLWQPDQAGEGKEKRSTMWYHGRWVNPWLRPFNTKHVITVAREGGAFQRAKWFPLLYPHNGTVVYDFLPPTTAVSS